MSDDHEQTRKGLIGFGYFAILFGVWFFWIKPVVRFFDELPGKMLEPYPEGIVVINAYSDARFAAEVSNAGLLPALKLIATPAEQQSSNEKVQHQ